MPIPSNAIEVKEPARTVDVLAGTFSYVDPFGVPVERPFYVRTVSSEYSELDGGHAASIRQNDLNQQLGDAFAMLNTQGYKSIHYADVRPNPFF